LTRKDKDKEHPGPFPTEVVADVLREHLLWQPSHGPNSGRMLLRAVLFADTPEARQTLALLGRGLAGKQRWKQEGPPRVSSNKATLRLCGQVSGQPANADGKPRDMPAPEPEQDPRGRPQPQLVQEWFEAKQCDALAPEWGLRGGLHRRVVDAVEKALQNDNREAGRPPAVLIVGHQPQLGQLADELSRHKGWVGYRRRRRLRVPLRHGEVACLAFEEPRRGRTWRPKDRNVPWWWRQRLRYRAPRVAWTISPADQDALDDVRDKIRSKLETAKLLGGVITVVLAALLALLFDDKKWTALSPLRQAGARASAGLLLAAVALYLATVYAYDGLLMPPRFWAELSPRDPLRPSRRGSWLVRRPPSSSAWLLYQNMQRAWWGLFTPATACVGIALILLALVITRASGWVVLASLALLALVAWPIAWFRPVLGSED